MVTKLLVSKELLIDRETNEGKPGDRVKEAVHLVAAVPPMSAELAAVAAGRSDVRIETYDGTIVAGTIDLHHDEPIMASLHVVAADRDHQSQEEATESLQVALGALARLNWGARITRARDMTPGVSHDGITALLVAMPELAGEQAAILDGAMV
jgi:hypothetical protein